MKIRCVSLCLISLLAAAACDLEAGPGQEIVLGNRGLALGVATPNAVAVRPGGSLVVEDADVLGRGIAVGSGAPPLPLLEPGAAIVSNGGRVRVIQGQVSGGNVLLQVAPQSRLLGLLAPALVATGGSTVVIEGGTLLSSGVFFASGGFGGNASFDFPSTVSVRNSSLRVSGGSIGSGERQDLPPPPLIFAPSFARSLDAERSLVEITGGSFGPGRVQLRGSNSRIRGGQIADLVLSPAPVDVLGSPPIPVSGCTELRGGSVSGVTIIGAGERLIVFGSGFNLPLGSVAVPGPATVSTVALSGTLEAGNAFAFLVGVASGASVSLAAPGSPGCPAGAL